MIRVDIRMTGGGGTYGVKGRNASTMDWEEDMRGDVVKFPVSGRDVEVEW